MKNMIFRVNDITKCAPLFSGPKSEHVHQKAFQRLIKKGAVAIDVGAQWGLHTLYLSKLVGIQGKVIALEPYGPAFNELVWHVQENRCLNVTALCIAAYDSEGIIELTESADRSMGIVKCSSYKEDGPAGKKSYVKASSLDAIVEECGVRSIDLIKIDCEGVEDRVLQGAVRIMARYQPCVIVESGSPGNDVFIGKWFTDRGYTLIRLSPSKPVIRRADLGWPHKDGVWGDILAVPGSSLKKIT